MPLFRFSLLLLLGTAGLLTPLLPARAASLSFISTGLGNYLAPLAADNDGNFYGTTVGIGNVPKSETVFRVTPAGVVTVLATFDGANGRWPTGALLLAKDGNIYGTTLEGGEHGLGTVFKVTPNGELTTLVSFKGSNGSRPIGGVIQAADGLIYGTTREGGAHGRGMIFKMTLNGVLTRMASFSGGATPFMPGGLTQGTDGNFYGSTDFGGTYDKGTIFKMTPEGALTIMASFSNANGGNAQGGVIQAKDGNFYGTTFQGGSHDNSGTVFQVTPSGFLRSLASFQGPEGTCPNAGLLQAPDGNFYGTAMYGGGHDGTVFRMTPEGVLNPVVRFSPGLGNPNGAGLILTPTGFYGTVMGGTGGGGIFRLTDVLAQTITFPQVQGAYGQTVTLQATASSGLPVTYLVSGPASLSGNHLTFLGVGTVYITASQSGDGTAYKAAGQTIRVVKVAKAAQTLGTFPIIPSQTLPASPFLVTPPTSSSGLPVSLTVKSGPATVDGYTVVPTGPGVVTLAANQAGNDSCKPAKALYTSFVVKKGSQTIPPIPAIPTQTFGVNPDTVQPTPMKASSLLQVVYSVKSGPATSDGYSITLTGAGTVVVAANQPGDWNYAAAREVTTSFKVSRGVRKFSFEPITRDSRVYFYSSFQIYASVFPSAPVTFRVTGPATLVDGVLTTTGAGVVSITATVAADADFLAVSATQKITVSKEPQVILFAPIGNQVVGGAVRLVAFTYTSLPITYQVRGPATVSGDVLTLTGTGNVTVIATQPGEGKWAAAQSVSQTIKVSPAP